MSALVIINDGNDVAESNFWSTIEDEYNRFFMSFTPTLEMSCRILLSPEFESAIDEMKTAKQTIIAFGPSSRLSGVLFYEIAFDDGSADPYAMRTTLQGADFQLSKDLDEKDVDLSVWLPDTGNSPDDEMSKARCVLRQKAKIRVVDDIDGAAISNKQTNSIGDLAYSWEDAVAGGAIIDLSFLTTGGGRFGCTPNAKQCLTYFSKELGRPVEDIILEVLMTELNDSDGECGPNGYGPILLETKKSICRFHIRLEGIDNGGPVLLFCLAEENELLD